MRGLCLQPPPSCCVCVFHIRSFCPKEAFIEATQPGLLTAFLATRGFKNLQMDQDSCCSDPSEDCKSLQKNTSPKESTNFLTHKWKGRSPTLPRKHPEHSKFFRFTPRGKQRTVRKSAMNSQSSLVFPDVFHEDDSNKKYITEIQKNVALPPARTGGRTTSALLHPHEGDVRPSYERCGD